MRVVRSSVLVALSRINCIQNLFDIPGSIFRLFFEGFDVIGDPIKFFQIHRCLEAISLRDRALPHRIVVRSAAAPVVYILRQFLNAAIPPVNFSVLVHSFFKF